MAGPNYVLDKGFKASAAIVKYRVVQIGANEEVATAGSATAALIGVCQEEVSAADATNGRIVAVRMGGISRCIAGAAITIGARVMPDAATGRVIAYTGAGNKLVGVAVQAAAAAGDHVDVLLTGLGVAQAA